MIASLPMYDLAEARAATDAWWRGLSRHLGIDAELHRAADYFGPWRNPGLVFSQTCGYPLTHEFRGKLKLLATPHYAADGCEGPRYRSIVFALEKKPLADFRGSVAAYNSADSMSGMLALKLIFAPHAEKQRFFSRAIETGGHLGSMAAVQLGAADICAIDAVTVAMARKYRPAALDGLIEIARSPAVPALPFVSSASRSDVEIENLRRGLAEAFTDPELARPREALFLRGISVLSENDYEIITTLEDEMNKAGGLTL